MTEEVKNLLQDYFAAASNLYGIIPLWKFLEIYNSQNEPPVTEEELKELTDSINFDERFYDLVAEDEIYETEEPTKYLNKTLTAEYLYCFGDWDDYVEMLDMQQGLNYYIPKKERFLRYKDEYFFEKTLEYIDLRAFFRNLPYFNKKEADEMAEEMYLNLRMEHGNDIRDAVYDAVRLGFNDDNEAEFEELCSLLVKLNKVVRKQCYRGQTQKEVFSDSGLMKLI
ncbi:MAG: hypothetical protein IIT39_16450 [Clostridia bacterium]|nr:hypothetical protein [Clostridia bacterium]